MVERWFSHTTKLVYIKLLINIICEHFLCNKKVHLITNRLLLGRVSVHNKAMYSFKAENVIVHFYGDDN